MTKKRETYCRECEKCTCSQRFCQSKCKFYPRIPSDDEFFVLISAFRYASGRQTYAMQIVASEIKRLMPRMNANQLRAVRREIDMRRDYASRDFPAWDAVGGEKEMVDCLYEEAGRRMADFDADKG